MADIIVLGKFYADSVTTPTPGPTEMEKKSQMSPLISFGMLIGILAAYLSWTCNTAQGLGTPEKVIYALFAYLFGGFYLIYYFFVRYPCGFPKPVAYYF